MPWLRIHSHHSVSLRQRCKCHRDISGLSQPPSVRTQFIQWHLFYFYYHSFSMITEWMHRCKSWIAPKKNNLSVITNFKVSRKFSDNFSESLFQRQSSIFLESFLGGFHLSHFPAQGWSNCLLFSLPRIMFIWILAKSSKSNGVWFSSINSVVSNPHPRFRVAAFHFSHLPPAYNSFGIGSNFYSLYLSLAFGENATFEEVGAWMLTAPRLTSSFLVRFMDPGTKLRLISKKMIKCF